MISELLPVNVSAFLKSIEEKGFKLCLVGGGVRDFLLKGTLQTDLDFEIRSEKNLSAELWEKEITLLRNYFREQKLTVEELPYLITRVNFQGFDLEFSSPRIEKNLPDNHSHHHFSADLNSSLSYAEAFKRRDITINAIGVEFNFKSRTDLLVDPYHGQEDLNNKWLRHIDTTFIQDHVRFFRIVRFEVLFSGFRIHQSTLDILSDFNLKHFSLFHFKREIKKSHNAALFLNRLGDLIINYSIPCSPDMRIFFKLKYPDDLISLDQVVEYALFMNPETGKAMAKVISFSEKRQKDVLSLMKSSEMLAVITDEQLSNAAVSPMEENLSLFRDLKNIFEKKHLGHLLRHKNETKKWTKILDMSLPEINHQQLTETAPDKRSLLKIHLMLKQLYQK